jgi:hypothetical protein
MKYATLPKTLPQILVTDSQVIVPSSVSSFHPSPYVVSSSSPFIHSSIIDSNASTQTSNMSEIFELVPTLPLPSTPPLSSILIEKNSNLNTNAISAEFQKN